jgi:hypothetical protein
LPSASAQLVLNAAQLVLQNKNMDFSGPGGILLARGSPQKIFEYWHANWYILAVKIIRSVLEYACPVWHCGLTANQSDDLERVQKRVLRIIYPNLSYHDALFVSGLERLSVRRERITRVLFEDIQKPSHVLHTLLTYKLNHNFNTRDSYLFEMPPAKTMRYSNSFIPYCIKKRY